MKYGLLQTLQSIAPEIWKLQLVSVQTHDNKYIVDFSQVPEQIYGKSHLIEFDQRGKIQTRDWEISGFTPYLFVDNLLPQWLNINQMKLHQCLYFSYPLSHPQYHGNKLVFHQLTPSHDIYTQMMKLPLCFHAQDSLGMKYVVFNQARATIDRFYGRNTIKYDPLLSICNIERFQQHHPFQHCQIK